jgi:Carboxypeptidase regulatory-like domain
MVMDGVMVMRTRILIGVAVMMLMGVLSAQAATISGVVTDTSGAAMPGTRVVLRDVATRQTLTVDTGPDGRFSIEVPTTGTYLISVTREGFSETAQTVVIDDLEQQVDVPLSLEVGSLATAVVVTASRAERDRRQIPLHVDTISSAAVEQTNPRPAMP